MASNLIALHCNNLGKETRELCSTYGIIYFLELNPPKTSLIISSNAEKYCSRFDYYSGKISKKQTVKKLFETILERFSNEEHYFHNIMTSFILLLLQQLIWNDKKCFLTILIQRIQLYQHYLSND